MTDAFLKQLDPLAPLRVRDFAAAWSEVLPLLHRLKSCPQDPAWHAEGDVEIHTDMVLDETRKLLVGAAAFLDPERRLILLLAALLHDIAKPLCTREVERDGRQWLICPGHEAAGYDYLVNRLPRLGLKPSSCREILHLVARHQVPKRLVMRDRGEAAWRALAQECDLELLYYLELADMRGRRCDDWQANVDCIELFRLGAEEHGLFGARASPWDAWARELRAHFPQRSELWHQHALARSTRDAAAGEIHSLEEAIARAHSLPAEFPQFFLLCGPGGCGKSRFAASLGGKAHVVNMDSIREELCRRRDDQKMNGTVLQIARERLKAGLRQPQIVVWDATSLRREIRERLLELARDYGAFSTIVAFQIDEKELRRNNRERPYPVPEDILSRQLESFEFPLPDEADHLIILNGRGSELRREGV